MMTRMRLPHRIGDLENCRQWCSRCSLLPHRIGDLETLINLIDNLDRLPHRIGDLEMYDCV